jgi:hypothetical protein
VNKITNLFTPGAKVLIFFFFSRATGIGEDGSDVAFVDDLSLPRGNMGPSLAAGNQFNKCS